MKRGEKMKKQDYIEREELEKATQNVLNSLCDKPRSYAILKMILDNAIEELDTICFIKSSE